MYQNSDKSCLIYLVSARYLVKKYLYILKVSNGIWPIVANILLAPLKTIEKLYNNILCRLYFKILNIFFCKISCISNDFSLFSHYYKVLLLLIKWELLFQISTMFNLSLRPRPSCIHFQETINLKT